MRLRRKRGESAAELRRELDELQRRAGRRSEFVALVAHDLRTPLAAVIGSVQTLQQRSADLSQAQRDALLAVIETEAERLTALIDDVFAASSIEADTFRYAFADVDVGTLVTEAVAAAIASRDVEIKEHVAAGLPVVRGDRARLRQVLSNLIDNAVKHAPGTTVEVGAKAESNGVVVAVTDHGAGIPLEDQRLIFEQFGRVSAASATEGTGLGLYISRAIAEAHGGSLDVSSAPGRGATFTLTLPPA